VAKRGSAAHCVAGYPSWGRHRHASSPPHTSGKVIVTDSPPWKGVCTAPSPACRVPGGRATSGGSSHSSTAQCSTRPGRGRAAVTFTCRCIGGVLLKPEGLNAESCRLDVVAFGSQKLQDAVLKHGSQPASYDTRQSSLQSSCLSSPSQREPRRLHQNACLTRPPAC
jgi:hypothetical protein